MLKTRAAAIRLRELERKIDVVAARLGQGGQVTAETIRFEVPASVGVRFVYGQTPLAKWMQAAETAPIRVKARAHWSGVGDVV